MLKQMCWLPRRGNDQEQKILHLRTSPNQGWRPYTCFPQFCVPDYREPGGSKGWATYQTLRNQGWNLIPTHQAHPSSFEDDQKVA